MDKIEILIESDQGHDTLLTNLEDAPKKVSDELNKDKWATIKKKDGTTELLTKSDAPAVDDWKNSFKKKVEVSAPSISSETVDKFKNKFEDVESVMVTGKAKGG